MSDLEKHFPRRGPCAFCGGPDARHRLFDAIKGMRQAGETVESLADYYEIAEEAIRAVMETPDGE